jgi:hypothetical protein
MVNHSIFFGNVCGEKGLLLSFVYNLVGWHASAISFPLSDIILAQLACLLNDVMFCLHSGITNLSLYKHCFFVSLEQQKS